MAVKLTKATVTKEREELYEITMNQINKVGGKLFVFIPLKLLYVDERFQRKGLTSQKKIQNLVNKWDSNKMDALRVSPHPEERCFSVIDGYHRYSAAVLRNGVLGLECELIQGLSEDPKKRLIQEATLFATQNDQVDTLSPFEKHKANVLRGIKENIIVEELTNKYDIPLKTNKGRGRSAVGYLSGFTRALTIAKSGEDVLDYVFSVICESRWNLSATGFSCHVLEAIGHLFMLHPTEMEEVKKALIDYCKPITPMKFFSEAHTKYPERKMSERLTMHLEDYVCEHYNVTRVYYGGIVKPLTRQK